jgi:hypothetical protein
VIGRNRDEESGEALILGNKQLQLCGGLPCGVAALLKGQEEQTSHQRDAEKNNPKGSPVGKLHALYLWKSHAG